MQQICFNKDGDKNCYQKFKKLVKGEYLELDKNSDEQYEFIDGFVYAQASPTVDHQRIVGKLFSQFSNYFQGKSCESFLAPLDTIWMNDGEVHKVQPDILVIGDKSGLNKNNYSGVPSLIFEVQAPSTASRDFIKKMDIYMRFGVQEYWIVSPESRTIQVFNLEAGVYGEATVYTTSDIVNSVLFNDFSIPMK